MTDSPCIDGVVAVLTFEFVSAAAEGGWRGWEQNELHRAEDAFRRANLAVVRSCGTSDEDEPWCVFTDEATGEELAHICRTSAGYACASRFAVSVMREPVLSELVDRLIGDLPARHGCGICAARPEVMRSAAAERGWRTGSLPPMRTRCP
jgi:hypothetical protein